MKISPVRSDVTPNLTTVTGLGIPEAEAGNRTQSEAKQEGYTGVKGEMTWVKQVLEKCLTQLATT